MNLVPCYVYVKQFLFCVDFVYEVAFSVKVQQSNSQRSH